MINTHNIKLDFGRHNGVLLTRIPLSYVKWMINELDKSRQFCNKKEIDKLIQLDFPNTPIDSILDNIKKDWIRTHQNLVLPHIYYWSDLARAELERRGDTLPKVEISGHAIDKASLRVLDKWRDFNRLSQRISKDLNNEKPLKKGLYSWLTDITLEALQHNDFKNNKYHYLGMKLAIEKGNEFPVLKTIMI